MDIDVILVQGLQSYSQMNVNGVLARLICASCSRQGVTRTVGLSEVVRALHPTQLLIRGRRIPQTINEKDQSPAYDETTVQGCSTCWRTAVILPAVV